MSGYYWSLRVQKKGYDPDQPRVPAGDPRGGQWTDSGGATSFPDYEMTGDTLGVLYHGGRTKISEVDPEMLQSRDHGYYGAGFYMTQSKDYAKAYGRTISKARLPKDARVLVSELNSKDASPRLVEDIRKFTLDQWEQHARDRGRPFDREQRAKDLEVEINSPVGWSQLVTAYGSQKGYDVIKHSSGEIVVRGYGKLEFLR